MPAISFLKDICYLSYGWPLPQQCVFPHAETSTSDQKLVVAVPSRAEVRHSVSSWMQHDQALSRAGTDVCPYNTQRWLSFAPY